MLTNLLKGQLLVGPILIYVINDMGDLKVLIISSGRFALPAMRDLTYSGQLSVVCIPEYSQEMIEESEALLRNFEIPIVILTKTDFENQLISAFQQYKINLAFVLSFGYKIPSTVYDYPQLIGFFNVHNGPLPEYRGADPVFQQIVQGENLPGATIHKLSNDLDAGDIVIQERIFADPKDTHGLLMSKLAELASKMVLTVVKMALLQLSIPSRPQNHLKARYFKKQTAKDVVIDWLQMDSQSIVRLINACNPWNKGAVAQLKHKIVRIISASALEEETEGKTQPGKILLMNDHGVQVSTKDGKRIELGIIHLDEGFFNAGILRKLGFMEGDAFSNLDNHV